MNDTPPQPPAEIGVSSSFRRRWSAMMLFATTVPYLLVFLRTPAGYTYTWIFPPYPDDSLAYMAWARQALHGQLLFSLKYCSIPHKPFMVQPFFLVAGWIGWLTGWSLGLVHLLLKCGGVLLFFKVFFDFLAFLQMPRPQARLAALLLGISSGVGCWYIWIFGNNEFTQYHPADLWHVDLNTYWSLLWNPLFPYSLTLILLVVRWIIEGTRNRSMESCWKGGAGTALLTLLHPYHIPFLYLFFTCLLLTRRSHGEWWSASVRFFGVSMPFVAYSALQSWIQPLLARHSITGRMESPAPSSILLGCGLPLVFAIFGAVEQRRQLQRLGPMLLWIVLACCLAYTPFWFQRKFFFGLHIPLCILAAYGMQALFRKPAVHWLLISLMAVTPVYLLQKHLRQAWEIRPDSPYLVSDELMGALDFLQSQSRPEEVVFATYNVSRLVPAYAGNTVLWGHWAQSVDMLEQRERFQAIFGAASGWTSEQRSAEFWKSGIHYVIVDPGFHSMVGRIPDWLQQSTRIVWSKGSIQVLKKR